MKLLQLLFIFVFICVIIVSASTDTLIVKELMSLYQIPDSLIDSVVKFEDGRAIELKLMPPKMYTENTTFTSPVQKLPEKFDKLTELERITVLNIDVIPGSLFRLKKLKELTVKSNFLREIPVEISYLRSLKVLDVNADSLLNITKNIYLLEKLEVLKIRGSYKCKLESGICKLNNLEEFYICKIQLPDNLFENCENSKIVKLTVQNTKLPISVGNIKKLESLSYREIPHFYLSSYFDGYLNKQSKSRIDSVICSSEYFIESIPDTIKKLKKLSYLNIASFHLDSIPSVVSELENLSTLTLFHVPAYNISASLKKIKKLKNLSLKYCDVNKNLSSILELKNIKRLDLRHNKIENIPDRIMKNNSIKELNFSNNNICNISDSLLINWINEKSVDKDWLQTQECN